MDKPKPVKPPKKEGGFARKSLRVIRNILLSAVAITIVFVGIAVIYVYFTEPTNSAEQVPEEEKQIELQPFGEPSTPAANAPVGVSVQALTSPVEPGSNASLSIKTLRDARCEISVEYDDVPAQDSGLQPKSANEYGVVGWAWTVEPATPEGEHQISVECTRGEMSGVVSPKFIVGENELGL